LATIYADLWQKHISYTNKKIFKKTIVRSCR